MTGSGIFSGKHGLVMGVANDKSIAYGIAKKLHEHGAQLAFSYQGEALERRVRPIAESMDAGDNVFECDVSDEASVAALFDGVARTFGKIDFFVHAVAYSDKEELRGKYIDTTRENFLRTMDISCYSFTQTARYAHKIMNKGGSMLTLTYAGSQRVMPHYNVMGVAKAALEASVRYLAEDLGRDNIRVNAISAGPVKTLAASGIGDFRYILKWNEYNSPMRRTITTDEAGGAAVFLLSDELGSGVTGEVLYVDCGYHVVGMKAIDAPDITKEE